MAIAKIAATIGVVIKTDIAYHFGEQTSFK